jgi:hypothetical protein
LSKTNKYLVVGPRWMLYSKINWPTDCRHQHQTQSHLHSQQLNAKSTSSSTRGLPASHSATAWKTYEHRAGSPPNEPFSLPHRLYHKPALKTSAKKTYKHPTCPPRNGHFPQRRPTTIQGVPHAMVSLQVHISGSSQAALLRAKSCRRVSM